MQQHETQTRPTAQSILDSLLSEAGMELTLPAKTESVAALLAANDYAVTAYTPALFARLNYISFAPDSWNADQIVAFCAVLEIRRYWAATPSLHDSKKSYARMLVERGTLPSDIDHWSPRQLLALLFEVTEPQPAREVFYESLRYKLADSLHDRINFDDPKLTLADGLLTLVMNRRESVREPIYQAILQAIE